MCFFANLVGGGGGGRVVSFRVLKVDQDGGHQGKWLHLGGQSKTKLQFCGSYLAVWELWESQFTKFL